MRGEDGQKRGNNIILEKKKSSMQKWRGKNKGEKKKNLMTEKVRGGGGRTDERIRWREFG